MPPGDLRIAQQRDGIAVLHRIQRVVERGVVVGYAAARRHRSNVVTDRELHDIRDTFVVILGLAGLGVDVVGVIAFLVETADCGAFVDCGNSITFVIRIPSYCFVLRIVICHRGIFLHAADGQQRQNLFAHRASCLGKRYGQIGIRLVDVAADLKFFFARLELVLYRGFADQRDFHSDGMPSRVRGIERLLGGKARSFFECKRICAVCKCQVDWNRAAVRRAIIAAANGIRLAHAPDLRPCGLSGDICAAAPFCRTARGYKDSTALATGLTAADDTARYAHVLSLGKSRCGQERQAERQRHEHTQYSFFHIFPP